MEYYVYILANKKRGTTYIGVTSDLAKRVWEHKNHVVDGYTTRYDVNKLVYYESTNEAFKAIEREKRIKKWKRDWKIELIESKNPKWRDLFEELI